MINTWKIRQTASRSTELSSTQSADLMSLIMVIIGISIINILIRIEHPSFTSLNIFTRLRISHFHDLIGDSSINEMITKFLDSIVFNAVNLMFLVTFVIMIKQRTSKVFWLFILLLACGPISKKTVSIEGIEIEYNQTAEFTIINVSYADLPHQNWIDEDFMPPLNGCWTKTPGAFITLIFNGTKVLFYGYVDPGHGWVDIYLDGKFVESINTKRSPREVNLLLYSSPDLPYGEHNITIQKPTNSSEFNEAVGFNCFKYIPTFKGNFSFVDQKAETAKNQIVNMKVSRITLANESASVYIETVDGTAHAGEHYTGIEQMVLFGKYETEKTVSIMILNFQSSSQMKYSFGLHLYNSTQFTTIGVPNALIEINDIGNEISIENSEYSLKPGGQVEICVIRRGGMSEATLSLKVSGNEEVIKYISPSNIEVRFAQNQKSSKVTFSLSRSIVMTKKEKFTVSLDSLDLDSYQGDNKVATVNVLMPDPTEALITKPGKTQTPDQYKTNEPTQTKKVIVVDPVIPNPTKENANTVNNARVEDKNTSGKKNNSLIIGGAVGGFLFLLLLILLILFIVWRTTKHAIESDIEENGDEDSDFNGLDSNDDLINSDDEIDTEALPSQQTTPSEEISSQTTPADEANDNLLQEDDSIEPTGNEMEEPGFHSLVINDINETPIEPAPQAHEADPVVAVVPPIVKRKKKIVKRKKIVMPDNNIIQTEENTIEAEQEVAPVIPRKKRVVRRKVRHPSKEIELLDVNE